MIPSQKKAQGVPVRGIVIGVVTVAALGFGLTQYNKYATHKRAIEYQQQVAAKQAADEKAAAEDKLLREAEEARRAAFDAEETAKEQAAKEKADAEWKAAEAKKLAEEMEIENASKEMLAFIAGARKFVGAEVAGVWDQGDLAKIAVWCLVPTDSGHGSYYEIVPGEKGTQVRTIVKGLVETLTYERFAKEVLAEHATVLLRTADGKVWLRTTMSEPKDRKLPTLRLGDDPLDLAAKLYGANAVKAVKVYRMPTPKFAWNVTFVTKKGRRLHVGTVAFGETIDRGRFIPAVTQVLSAKVEKINTVHDRRMASDVFKLSFKRTHFLYDGPAIKRTVDSKTYVPRTEPNWSDVMYREQVSRQGTAKLHDEWVELHAEAKRQGDGEAREIAVWEKAKFLGKKIKLGLSVSETMINYALDSGYIVYEPVKKKSVH